MAIYSVPACMGPSSIGAAEQRSVPGATRSAFAAARWRGCALDATVLSSAAEQERARAFHAVERSARSDILRGPRTNQQPCTALDRFAVSQPCRNASVGNPSGHDLAGSPCRTWQQIVCSFRHSPDRRGWAARANYSVSRRKARESLAI